MVLMVGLLFILLVLSSEASLIDPWGSCPADKMCKAKFANNACDMECSGSQCLRDGFDCFKEKDSCNPDYLRYCRDHYDDNRCEKSCNKASCGWDGSDCYKNQRPRWARGTLVLQTNIPFQNDQFNNVSLLWAISTLLQTSVKFRAIVPFQTTLDLTDMDAEQLVDLHRQTPTYKSNGSLLFLQVDNRPCSQQPSTCFPYATEAADFLNAVLDLNRAPAHVKPELQSLVSVQGIHRDIDTWESAAVELNEKNKGSPSWLWPVVGVAIGVGVALIVVGVVVVLVWRKRRRETMDGGERMQHSSTATDDAKAWARHSSQMTEGGGGRRREKDRKNGIRKKRKGKEERKRRSEPLGEDAIRMRPLKKDMDISSDTDMTQSSMEDIKKTICDHRSPVQRHYNINHQQPPVPAPPRRWDRDRDRAPPPIHPRTPTNSAPVQWCGPDGSVVLIRAVRSGLDRVVLELLRAGVPVNNTDHTGRSALHWACSVNHLSLARTLIRYGAAIDLQDHKGESPLFLASLHGCYETARFLLLNGANQELTDCRGRRPIDVARDGLHHQVLELLLAHRVPRSPFPLDTNTEVLWDDRSYLYAAWPTSPPTLPGRSASFSGILNAREMASPPPSDWQMSQGQGTSPQNWRSPPNQSATALVSPRILGGRPPPRPISTLQEVTSEAEEEGDREATQEVARATTPHFLSPQPAPRQRSFSCTQHALQRRASANRLEMPVVTAAEKQTNENVEIVLMPRPKNSSGHSQGRTGGTIPVPKAVLGDSEKDVKRSSEPKGQNETVSSDPTSVQTVM